MQPEIAGLLLQLSIVLARLLDKSTVLIPSKSPLASLERLPVLFKLPCPPTVCLSLVGADMNILSLSLQNYHSTLVRYHSLCKLGLPAIRYTRDRLYALRRATPH